ncbi:MAG: tryptophan synthase subunit alpha [Phycisphaeraceae bacterium]|nr:tryptophan synthase subunit alpha [Phycisphaeraceae bacterium]
MGRLAEMFARHRVTGTGALMPFIVAGDPTLGDLPALLQALESAGADAVEIGIPFSDPIADGPLIAAAMHAALERGTRVESVLERVRDCRDSIRLPLLAMVSVSIVDRLGGATFIEALSDAGFDGVIVPDADLDTIEPLVAAAEAADIGFSTLLAPDTSPERAARIASTAREFLYLLARRGITGERGDAPDLEGRVGRIREITALPLAAGFGISSAEHVATVVRDADGAIVGSALVRAIGEAVSSGEDLADAVVRFVEPLATAAHRSNPS